MRLWIVTNNWLGNANEGAIVQAENQAAAIEAARQALISHTQALLDAEPNNKFYPEGTPHQQHLREKLDTYRPDCDIGWRARAIDLPHIGEF